MSGKTPLATPAPSPGLFSSKLILPLRGLSPNHAPPCAWCATSEGIVLWCALLRGHPVRNNTSGHSTPCSDRFPGSGLPFDTERRILTEGVAAISRVSLCLHRARSFQLPATALLPDYPDPDTSSTTSITPIPCVCAQIEVPGFAEFAQQGIS